MKIEEYNQCVDEYADALYGFALKSVKNEDTAKDLVQDAFERLWLKLADVQSGKGKSYLFMIVHHSAIDFHRKEKLRNDHIKQQQEPILYIPNSDIKEHVNYAVTLLSEIQRHLIMLRDYEGYSYQEIGEITKLSEQQVKVYIFRARKQLKNYFVSIDNLI